MTPQSHKNTPPTRSTGTEGAKPRKCPCGALARHQRTLCQTCRTRQWRANQPITAAYDNLRSHARARGKAFALTLAEFRRFCLETGYHLRKGVEAYDLTIDRIDPRRGYEPGNIQAVSQSFNARKGWFERLGLLMGDADETEDAA